MEEDTLLHPMLARDGVTTFRYPSVHSGQEEKIRDLLFLPLFVLDAMLEVAARAILVLLPVWAGLLVCFLLLERMRLRMGRWWRTTLLVIACCALYCTVIACLFNAVTAIESNSPWAVVSLLWIGTAFSLITYGSLRSASLGTTGSAAIGVTLLGSISFGFLGASLAFPIVYLIALLS